MKIRNYATLYYTDKGIRIPNTEKERIMSSYAVYKVSMWPGQDILVLKKFLGSRYCTIYSGSWKDSKGLIEDIEMLYPKEQDILYKILIDALHNVEKQMRRGALVNSRTHPFYGNSNAVEKEEENEEEEEKVVQDFRFEITPSIIIEGVVKIKNNASSDASCENLDEEKGDNLGEEMGENLSEENLPPNFSLLFENLEKPLKRKKKFLKKFVEKRKF